MFRFYNLSLLYRIRLHYFSKIIKELIKTQSKEFDHLEETKIYSVKICREGAGNISISVRHTGPFCLADYKELELEIKSARLVKS
jgi:hypothetical protein